MKPTITIKFSILIMLLCFITNSYSAITITQSGNDYIIDNGTVAVKVPAVQGTGVPAPIKQFKLNGNWYGSGTITLQSGMTLKSFKATQLSDGVRLQYLFQSCKLDSPFLDMKIRIKDATGQVNVEETYQMGTGSFYSFEASSGWSPSEIKVKTWYWADGSSSNPAGGSGDKTLSLQPRERFSKTAEPMRMFLMQPRWTQNADVAYYAALQNSSTSITVGVCRASKWYFPHDSYISGRTVTGGGKLFFDFPTQRGGRFYLLIGGDATTFTSATSILDSYQSYTGGPKFYDGNWGNPTGGTVRGTKRTLIADIKAGKLPNCNASEILNLINPDFWGYPQNQWSPINPNFYSDLVAVPALKACGCKNDPKFNEIKQKLQAVLEKHFEINFALPGGAGECSGYHSYALEESGEGITTWGPMVKQHLGIDILSFTTVAAGRNWITEFGITPQGDTHQSYSPKSGNLSSTKEYPMYGIYFKGAGDMYWKSSSMRGHFHGDQLSFHNSKAKDHQLSYSPRPDQEHMHNRVWFTFPDWEYANMDGYEHIIAYKSTSSADVGVGQVESNLMRKQPKLPEQYVWQARLEERALSTTLKYRRTVVLVKSSSKYYVIRDQHWGPNLKANFAIHTSSSSDAGWSNNTLSFSNLKFYFAKPSSGLTFTKFNYSTDKNLCPNGCSNSASSKGAFISQTGTQTEFITVMWDGTGLPSCSAIAGGVQVGNDKIIFADPTSDPNSAVVTVNGTVIIKSSDVDEDRPQGYGYLDKGRAKWDGRVYVPEAGYPMGPMPEWLLAQKVPGYSKEKSVCSNDLILNATINDVSCGMTNNGSINLTVLNGTTPYTYNWSNTQTTKDITGLTAGNYTVTVTDAALKTKIESYIVIQNSSLQLTTSITHSSGSNNGAIDLNVSSGTTPYTYIWNNGSVTEDLTGLNAGTYTVTVNDKNGCSKVESYIVSSLTEIEELQLINATIYPNPSDGIISIVGIEDAEIKVYNLVGILVYSTNFINSESIDLSSLQKGIYSIQLTRKGKTTIKKIVIN